MWLLLDIKFRGLKPTDLLLSWKGRMSSNGRKVRYVDIWAPPGHDVMKFNVDGVARGKPGPTGIGGVLRSHAGS